MAVAIGEDVVGDALFIGGHPVRRVGRGDGSAQPPGACHTLLPPRTVELEHEREEKAKLAVTEERARIARELHDVVAHNVSMMVVQAGAERRAIGDERPETTEVLETIEDTGRSAMAEMRRLLGMLRRSDDDLALAPQPSLRHLGDLVEQVREAGMPVDLRIEGEERELAPGIDLSAYRIVQEALTNALKHAGPARARVTVRYGESELDIEIADDGTDAGRGGACGRARPRRDARARGHVRGRPRHGPAPRRRLRGPRAAPARRRGAVIRVLLADDQALVRGGLRKIVETEPDMTVVAEAEDGLQAVDSARAAKPDVAVLDIRMPHLDGIEATRRIVAALGDEVRVLMLTTFGLDDYVFDALRAGASGFMLKDAPPEELLDAIRVVAGGAALLAPAVTRAVVAEFARRSPAASADTSPRLEELTEREREVLMLLTRGRSNAEIAADLVVSDATVKTHVAHVLMKLGVRDRVQAVIFAYEAGLVSPGEA